MEQDESGTHARLRGIHETIILPAVTAHGGRIVKTAGDGMVIEFSSATAALLWSVDVQRQMGHQNLYTASDVRIQFRIGVNLGDILIDGDDIAGDGVNVAARLETLAVPGGICVSSTVFEQIHGDPGFGFVDMGEQQVKNLARPIRVYRVSLATDETPRIAVKRLLRGKRGVWAAVGSGTLALVVVAAIAVHGFPGQATNRNVGAYRGPAGPPPMSIAILPFTMTAGNATDAQLGETLTRDVTGALGGAARYLHVISYALAAAHKGTTVDARSVGQALNVRYLAEGELRHADGKLVLNATLIDTASATEVWNDQFEIPPELASKNRDAIVAQVTKGIRIALVNAETRRVARQPRAGATPGELVLRGNAAMEDKSPKGRREALSFYDEALRLDPNLVSALLGHVWATDDLRDLDPTSDRARLMREMDDFSLRAIAADRLDPLAWVARAGVLERQYRWAEAKEALAEVLRLDPYRNGVYLERAWISIWNGDPEAGLDEMDKQAALDLREANSGAMLFARCRAQLSLGRYDDAIHSCERSVTLDNKWTTYMFLTAAYAQRGEMTKALRAREQLLKLLPGFTISAVKTMGVSDNAKFWAQTETHIFSGLRKAGLPEQ